MRQIALFPDFSPQCVGVSRTEFSLMVVTIVAVVGEKPENEIEILNIIHIYVI